MAEHSRPLGKRVIRALLRLGKAFGYVAKYEHPIAEGEQAANDVAWLADRHQDVPLMVFEVESLASNAAAHNVTKVFGRFDRRKPLFFFHIFLSVHAESPRIAELRAMFGTYNYRTYCLPADSQLLVLDVLDQHRRLSRRLRVVRMFAALRHPVWRGLEIPTVAKRIEDLGLEYRTGRLAPSYAALALRQRIFIGEYVRYARERWQKWASRSEQDDLSSWWNYQVGSYIEFAIVCGAPSASDVERLAAYERLVALIRRTWIGNARISSYLGHRQETDVLVLDLLAPVWALIAVLTRDVAGSTKFWCEKCWEIVDAVKETKHRWIFAAAWLLHISASMEGTEVEFERIKVFVNERGGLPEVVLQRPPSFGVAYQENPTKWPPLLKLPRVLVPPLHDFRLRFKRQVMGQEARRVRAIRLGLELMFDESIHEKWGPAIRRLLWAVSPTRP
jgi:hypothetical protein